MTYLNIVASDGPLIQQYIDTLEAGNQTQANQILAQIPSASTIKATTYSHISKDVTANLTIIEGDVETDPYLTATYSYTDSRSGKGIYSEPVTIANLALGASATDETEYKEKPGIELPGILQSAVYGA